MGCLADSFPSFTLFRLYHRRSTAWMGLGRASPSYCCHFGVISSWWVPPCGSVWGDLVWWSYPHHVCIGSLHGYPVTSSNPAGAELSSYDSGTAVPPQHEPSGLGSVSVEPRCQGTDFSKSRLHGAWESRECLCNVQTLQLTEQRNVVSQ